MKKILIPGLFAWWFLVSCAEPAMDLHRIIEKDRYGYINSQGKMVIKPAYLYAGEFFEGLAPASRDGKLFGYIDTQGKWAIPEQFEKAGAFSEGLAPAVQGQKLGILKKTGEWLIPPSAERVALYNETYELAVRDGIIGLSVPTPGSSRPLFGFWTKEGRVLKEPSFDMVSAFSEGLAVVVSAGKAGYMNTKGDLAIPQKYPLALPFSEGLGLVSELPGEYAFIDAEGKTVLDFTGAKAQMPDGRRIRSFSPFKEGLAVVRLETPEGLSLFGAVDKKGEWVIPAVHTLLRSFSEGLAVFQKDSKLGYLDPKGAVAVEPKYDDAQAFHQGLAEVTEGNKVMYINKKGETIWQMHQGAPGQEPKP